MLRLPFGTAGFALTWMAILASPGARAANLLVNPGFELPDASGGDATGIIGWTEFGAPFTRFVTRLTPANSGLQCLKMFGPFDFFGGGTGVVQRVPASAGQTWLAQVWSMNSSADAMQGGNFCVLKLEFYDAVGQFAGGAPVLGVNYQEVRVADAASPLDVWLPFSITLTAPPGTAFAQIVLVEVQLTQPFAGGAVFLDDAFLDQVCALHDPVFDTNDDAVIDENDLAVFDACFTGPAIPLADSAAIECRCLDVNGDNAIDLQDYGVFQRCYTGAGGVVDPSCDD
ncbi:MAG: EF-hand domain-containing protein [Phycisphaerae bacterium]|jgi:hypothetical protein